MTEQDIIKQYLLEYSKQGHRLFRNNTGTGWQGVAHHMRGKMLLVNPRPLHAGLCKGSSDLIGITKVKITPDMVGQTLGVFTALEIKTGNTRVTKEQKNFVQMVNDMGGIGKIIRKKKTCERENITVT